MNANELRVCGDAIAMTVSAIDRTEHQLLGLLRDFDAAKGWHAAGATSFAAWLSWRCGMSRGAARERIRVANALGQLPLIDGAFAAGEISYSKARALTRVATAKNEETLLASARAMTAAELEKLCQMLGCVSNADPVAEPQRLFSERCSGDGMIRFTVTLPADEAAVVTAALDALAVTPNRRAEALVELAEQSCRGTAADKSPTEVVLHIEAADLSGRISAGTPISAETSARLLCDAGVVPVLSDQSGKTLDVGRKTRVIPTAIRRALAIRDGGCRFPGCSHAIVDGHHIEHWSTGGETKLENLASLCRSHHRLVHEGGARVLANRDGSLEFRNRDGALLLAALSPAPAQTLRTRGIDPWLAVATGDKMVPIDWDSQVSVAASC
jgi:hypothetical protein